MQGSKIRVLVNGARGRMGREVVQAVRAEADLELVGELDIGDDLPAGIEAARAQVVVDFTQPSAAAANTEAILRSGAHPIVGTTGFTPADIERLSAIASSVGRGGLIAPNFAIGAVLLMRLAAEAARHFPHVEIIEMHHDQKLDAPSGTALRTAEAIRRAQALETRAHPQERESVPGVRGGRSLGIPIHSVRLPGYVAHQEVLFGGPGQILSLRHDSISRASFMPGVILAVRRIVGETRLIVGLEAMLGL